MSDMFILFLPFRCSLFTAHVCAPQACTPPVRKRSYVQCHKTSQAAFISLFAFRIAGTAVTVDLPKKKVAGPDNSALSHTFQACPPPLGLSAPMTSCASPHVGMDSPFTAI